MDKLSGEALDLYKGSCIMRFAYGRLLKVEDADIQNGQFVFPEEVGSIEPKAFAGCRSLASITVPSTVTHIGVGALKDCLNLASVVIPNGVTSIANYAFKDYSKMGSVVIPPSYQMICRKKYKITIICLNRRR